MDTTKFGSFYDLLDISPPSQHAAMQRLGEIVQFVAPDQRFDFDHPLLLTLQQAIRERRVVRLRYHR